MKVYVVCGGCAGDQHIIAIYKSKRLADARVERENRKCHGLNAYFEAWNLLGEGRNRSGQG